MKPNAIAVANYFVELSNEDDNVNLPLLKLMKLVYIGYGFCLALLNRSIINENYDRVEAWKYGPVIPSVYHSFKHHGSNNITECAKIVKDFDEFGMPELITPRVNDEQERMVLRFVWNRYKSFEAMQLVNLLHQDNTPWKFCYAPGENNEIPQEITKMYYDAVVNNLKANGRG